VLCCSMPWCVVLSRAASGCVKLLIFLVAFGARARNGEIRGAHRGTIARGGQGGLSQTGMLGLV